MTTVFVDVDGVVANLYITWLELYNNEYKDNLTENGILEWGIEKFVKPECGLKIFKYIENPFIYDDVLPIPGALEKINFLKSLGFRIVYATTPAKNTYGVKYDWLTKYSFIESRNDYIEIHDKSLLLGDYLVDDNLNTVKKFRGAGILYTQPWNKRFKYAKRANNWHQVLYHMNLVKFPEDNIPV